MSLFGYKLRKKKIVEKKIRERRLLTKVPVPMDYLRKKEHVPSHFFHHEYE